MATQYTSILKLALPTEGELSGTWGDVVNDNITSMVEEAIAGRAVIDSWTANGHTLTTANGTTAEARCAMLEFTDTNTDLTGNAEVICPTASKIYIAKNATGAGYSVTVKTSAGTGIAVPDGETMFLFCDGTNVVEAITSVKTLKIADGVQVNTILDEDNMASDSATALATQQSIKAYVDAQVTAQDLDIAGDSGTGAIDLDSQLLTVAGTANEIETAASGQTITVGLPSVVIVTTSVTTPTVQATNINANDGSTSATIADSTGVMTIASSVLTTTDINGGTIDNSTIATSNITVGAGKTLDVSAGTLTLANDQISGDKIQGGTIGSTTITTLASTTGNITTVNATTVDTTSIEVTNVKAKDGTASATIADSTGVMTIASSVLTTTDINGGTIDGVTIGGASAGAGTFANLKIEANNGSSPVDPINKLILKDTDTGAINGQYMGEIQFESSDTDNPGVMASIYSVQRGTLGGGNLVFETSPDTAANKVTRINISQIGDISFYEDTGTTPKFFWDASTERLGIGNVAPTTALDVTGTVTADGLTVDGNSRINGDFTIDTAPRGYVFASTLEIGSGGTLAVAGNANTSLMSNIYFASDNTYKVINTGLSAAAHQLYNGSHNFSTASAAGTAGSSIDLFTRMNIAKTGDISFYEDTGTTPKFFWDASTERLGIGTTSPAVALHVVGNILVPGTSGTIYGNSTAGSRSYIEMYNVSTGDMSLATTFSTASIKFLTGSTPTERLRINSSGSVGIGTIPNAGMTALTALQLGYGGGFQSHASSTNSIYVLSNAYYDGAWKYKNAGAATEYKGISGEHIWETAASGSANGALTWTERMRLDSSGNLLVGTTSSSGASAPDNSSSSSNDGIRLSPSGFIGLGAYQQPSAYFNRMGNDGDIVEFNKDGSPVGVIGAVGSAPYFATTVGATLVGIKMQGGSAPRIVPTSGSGATTDNVANIGSATERFKDLYLSGSAYINGVTVGRGAGAVSTNTAVGASALAVNTSGANNTAVGYRAGYTNTTGFQNTYVGGFAGYSKSTGESVTAVGYNALYANTSDASTAVGRQALVANTSGVNTAVGERVMSSNTTGSFNAAFGHVALQANTTGSNNTAVGRSALFNNTTAINNTAVGFASLNANTEGASNVAVGRDALYSNTTASNNTAVGFEALYDNQTGTGLVAVGYRALTNNTASNNTAVGFSTLNDNTSGAQNTGMGHNALYATTSGSWNTGIGQGALQNNTTASDNTAVGGSALGVNTTGASNVAIGRSSLGANTTASNNTAVGKSALGANTTGANNTAVGYEAALSTTTPEGMTAVGSLAARTNTTGASVTAVGHYTLYSNTTGASNTGVGRSALQTNSTGSNNTAVGRDALISNTEASNSVAVGYHALYANTTGSINVAVGGSALDANTTGSTNVAVGGSALGANTTASNNIAVGYNALVLNTTGSENVALGRSALETNTTGGNNTAVGYQAGFSNTTGAGNTFIGRLAGYSSNTSGDVRNTFVGFNAGYGVTTGTANTFIGAGPNGGAGEVITTGSKNTILGSYNGNQGGLDIRTASNYIVLSDGDGNPRGVFDASGNLGIGNTSSGYVLTSGEKRLTVGDGAEHSAIQLYSGTGKWGAIAFSDDTANEAGQGFIGYYHPDNYMQFNTNGTERLRIDSSGRLLVNTTASRAQAGLNLPLFVEGTNYTGIGACYNAANSTGSFLALSKSRGTANGSNTIVNNNDQIGEIYFSAADGTDLETRAATIAAFVDGVPGSNDMPGRLVFSTTADGAATPTERMRLDSSGNLGLGVTPNAWSANYKAIQSGNGSAFAGFNGNDQTFVVSNAYNDGAWKYKNSAGAGRYTIQGVGGGVHAWFTAPSGTAGNAITFTQAMTLDASGRLGIGTTLPNRNVEVSSLYDTTLRLASTRNTNSWTVGDVIGQVEMYSADGTAPTASVRASVAAVVEDASGASTGLVFRTYNNTERLRITSTGNVGIGTTSATSISGFSKVVKLEGPTNASYVVSGGVQEAEFAISTNGGFLGTVTNLAMRFATNNSERMRIDTSGRLLVNTTASRAQAGLNLPLFVEGTNYTGIGACYNAANNVGSFLALSKSRGTANGSNTIVNNNDQIGEIFFSAADGTDLETRAATIAAFVDGVPGSNDMPGRLVFSTTADGAATPTERLRILSNGNVGIGTTSPTGKMDVQTATDSKLVFQDGNTAGNTRISSVNSAYSAYKNFELNTAQTLFFTNGAERMRIDSSGNVGIGTSSPSYKLSVAGNSATSSNILLTHNTDSTGAYSRIRFQFAEGNTSIASEIRNIQRVAGASGSNLAFFTENNSGTLVEAARIDFSGNVGIGTTSPAYKLDVSGSSEVLSRFVRTGGSNALFLIQDPTTTSAPYIGSHGNAMAFGRYGSGESMRIDSSGNVMVGTTSASGKLTSKATLSGGFTTAALTVESGASGNVGIALHNPSSNAPILRAERGAGDAIDSVNSAQSAFAVFRASAFTVSSDYRIKENVESLTGALDRVSQLKPCRFSFVKGSMMYRNSDVVDGFIAHEVSPVVPEAVTGIKDELKEDGTPNYQSLDQAKLVPLLTAAIQELKAELDTLKAEIQTLKGD